MVSTANAIAPIDVIITVPVVVLPYSFWARTRLHQAGLADPRRAVRAAGLGAVLAVPITIGVHRLARLLMRRRLNRAVGQRGREEEVSRTTSFRAGNE